MKKFVLLVAISSTFIMCQKQTAKFEEVSNSIDSASAVATDAIDHASKTADMALDSASIKIKDFENTKNDIQEKIETTSKMVDSLSDKITSTKLESKIEKKIQRKKKRKRLW